ncbi:unnamed protein product, partial [Urochloa humidicola]
SPRSFHPHCLAARCSSPPLPFYHHRVTIPSHLPPLPSTPNCDGRRAPAQPPPSTAAADDDPARGRLHHLRRPTTPCQPAPSPAAVAGEPLLHKSILSTCIPSSRGGKEEETSGKETLASGARHGGDSPELRRREAPVPVAVLLVVPPRKRPKNLEKMETCMVIVKLLKYYYQD